jgi:hypothetical protein
MIKNIIFLIGYILVAYLISFFIGVPTAGFILTPFRWMGYDITPATFELFGHLCILLWTVIITIEFWKDRGNVSCNLVQALGGMCRQIKVQ